jgi:hypothetical protein
MTRRKSEGAEALSDEEQRKAIQAQIKTITEAKDAIQAAMRALPLDGLFRDPIIGEQSLSLRADKYVAMAFASLAYRPPQAKSDIESQISEIKGKANDLLMSLCGLNTLAVDAIHLAMKEGDYPPKERLRMETAAMVIDPRPKALGDIMGRLEVLIDAAGRADALAGC